MMNELLQKIRDFRNKRDWDQFHSPKNLSTALVIEAAELAEHFQWLTQEQSRNLSDKQLAEIKDEIGDVLIYLVNLSDKLNINPLEAAHAKLEKNKEKYPADKVKGKADKYSTYK